MNQNNADYLIDLEEIIKSKSKKKIPQFLINYIIKIAQQDGINECIANAKSPAGVAFFKEALDYLDITFTVKGAENLPKDGRYIFAANHPLGGPEALILGEVFHQEFGESFRVPVNSILANFKPLKEFFVPINLMGGKQTKELSYKMNEMFNSEYQVLVFPAGKCARKIKGKVTEMPWKKMFISRAKLSQRDVIPIHFSGHNSNFFYFLCKLSDCLKLKFNIGMLYLADELFKQKHRHFTITFGQPIPWESFDKSKTDVEWAQEVRKKSLDLPL